MQTRSHTDSRSLTSENLANRVKDIVAAYLDLPRGLVIEEANLSHDLGADSLEITEMVMVFEEEFGFEIDDSGTDRFLTVGDIINHLQNLADTRS